MAQFTNQATLSYNGMTISSNIVTGEITQVLELQKKAVIDSYRADDTLTYVLTLRNTGTADYTDLTVTDDLGAYAFGGGTLTPLTYTGDPVLYYVGGVLQAAPTVTAGPPLVISGLRVPAGQSTVLIYRARVNAYANPGAEAQIRNTASLTGGGLAEAVTAEETVTSVAEPQLTILKSVSPTSVAENGELLYTFILQNTGTAPADAGAALTVTDTFNPILRAPLTVTLNGDVWPQEGNYTYSAATGEFATVAGRITVPAATYTQNPATGIWSVTPGTTTLTVSGSL